MKVAVKVCKAWRDFKAAYKAKDSYVVQLCFATHAKDSPSAPGGGNSCQGSINERSFVDIVSQESCLDGTNTSANDELLRTLHRASTLMTGSRSCFAGTDSVTAISEVLREAMLTLDLAYHRLRASTVGTATTV
jgi:hypothetical protein